MDSRCLTSLRTGQGDYETALTQIGEARSDRRDARWVYRAAESQLAEADRVIGVGLVARSAHDAAVVGVARCH